MVIQVGDSRVYRFEGSTIICDIYHDFAEVLVLPERRRFILQLKQDEKERFQQAYPEHTLQYILSLRVAYGLRDRFLRVDEEVSA